MPGVVTFDNGLKSARAGYPTSLLLPFALLHCCAKFAISGASRRSILHLELENEAGKTESYKISPFVVLT